MKRFAITNPAWPSLDHIMLRSSQLQEDMPTIDTSPTKAIRSVDGFCSRSSNLASV